MHLVNLKWTVLPTIYLKSIPHKQIPSFQAMEQILILIPKSKMSPPFRNQAIKSKMLTFNLTAARHGECEDSKPAAYVETAEFTLANLYHRFRWSSEDQHQTLHVEYVCTHTCNYLDLMLLQAHKSAHLLLLFFKGMCIRENGLLDHECPVGKSVN